MLRPWECSRPCPSSQIALCLAGANMRMVLPACANDLVRRCATSRDRPLREQSIVAAVVVVPCVSVYIAATAPRIVRGFACVLCQWSCALLLIRCVV